MHLVRPLHRAACATACMDAALITPCRPCSTAPHLLYACRLPHLSRPQPPAEPVSYTHLDVYKRQAKPGGGLAAALQRPVIGMRLNTRERLFHLHHLSPGLQTGSHCANKAVSFLPSAASLARCLKLTLFTGQLRQLQNLRPHPEDVRAGPQIRPKQ